MRAPSFLLVLALAGCGAPERPGPDRFAATGQLIALSGGDAGAENACFGCHGLQGQGNGAGAPRLAGLGVGYLNRQMEFYAEGLRQHPTMHAIAKRLSGRDRQAVSAYYAAMRYGSPPALAGGAGGGSSVLDFARKEEPPLAPPRNRGGERLYTLGDPLRALAPCATCHGAQGQGVGLGNPPLAGQPAAYLVAQLGNWRAGKRRGDPVNIMLRISQRLTPAEVLAVSAYASALPGSPRRPEYPAASLPARRGDPRNDASAPPQRAAE